MPPGQPAASFKFNSFQEIKSHSSILFNERMAILFYRLDNSSIDLNMSYKVDDICKVKSIIWQIYKNIRTLLRNNPVCRSTLNLDTKDPGIYTLDVAMNLVDSMVQYCGQTEYTTKKIYIIVQELNKIEMVLKDVLQYYHYFIRPDFRQKPDIELATETYKEIADKRTIEELREIVGRKHTVDFEGLGSKRVELNSEIAYDPEVDDLNIEEKNDEG